VGSWALAFGITGLVAMLVDISVGSRPPSALEGAWALGIGVPLATMIGSIWGGAFVLLSRRSLKLRGLFWAGLGVAAAWTLADALGVFPRLVGKERDLAIAALIASLAAGFSLPLFAALMQPTQARPGGVALAGGARRRVLVLVGFVVVGVAALVIDRGVQTETYPSAHTALRGISLCAFGFAVVLASPRARRFRLGRWRRRAAFIGVQVGLLLVPWGTMTEGKRESLHFLLARPLPGEALRIVRGLSDVDGDGFSGVFGGGDCAPLDPAVSPGAREIANNGVDDNCQLGDLTTEDPPAEDPPRATEPSPTSVVLITVDALQAGHLSAYGWHRSTSPQLDRWGEKALRFERAYTSGGYTTIALSSLFRGRHARRLRWTRLRETNTYRLLREPAQERLKPGERLKKGFLLPLEDPRRTLPDLLRRRGMHTAAVVDDSYTHVLDPEVGGFPGFDDYVVVKPHSKRSSNDDRVTEASVSALREMPDDRPFFLWVHYFGVHGPSQRHVDVQDFGEGVADRYDHEIRSLDQEMVGLLDELERLQRERSIAVILTSDHGEVLKPRWRGHGHDLREAGIHIPLWIQGPGFEPGASDVPTSSVDLMPTILHWTRTPAPSDLDGVELAGLLREPRERVLITETWRFSDRGEVLVNLVSAFNGELKVEYDLLTMARRVVYQGAEKGDRPSPLAEPPMLAEGLGEYLERYGALRISD